MRRDGHARGWVGGTLTATAGPDIGPGGARLGCLGAEGYRSMIASIVSRRAWPAWAELVWSLYRYRYATAVSFGHGCLEYVCTPGSLNGAGRTHAAFTSNRATVRARCQI